MRHVCIKVLCVKCALTTAEQHKIETKNTFRNINTLILQCTSAEV